METAYGLGVLFGKFFAGVLCGLFPLIVALVKKRALLGMILMVVCGLLSFVHPILSVVVAVVSGIVLCIMRKKM